MAILIIYGKPPKTATFDGHLTSLNRSGFERLLVPELEKLAGRSFRPFKILPICHPGELGSLLKAGAYDTVVFYGHGRTFTTETREREINELYLETACGKYLTPSTTADALRGTTARTILLAGCNSASLAADLSTRLPGIRAGGLRHLRIDAIAGNPNAIFYLRITPQEIIWWPK